MATHDYVIANQSGAAFRTDLNNALAAIVSNNSNSSEPATMYAYQWWADTNTGTLKIRNSSNNGWVELLQLDGTLTMEDGSASTPGLAFRNDLNTGLARGGADILNLIAGGDARLKLGATTIFNESGADVDFRIESDTLTHAFFLQASDGRIGINVSSPTSPLHISGGADNTILQIVSTDAGAYMTAIDNTGAGSFGQQGANTVITCDSGASVASSAIVFQIDGNSEKMRIDSSGRVHIGTATNRLGETLHVLGQGIMTSSAENTNMMLFGTFGGSTALIGAFNNIPVVFRQNNTERMRIDSSGGVRFGATAAIQSEKYTFFRQESDANTLAYFHQGASADVTGIIMRHGRGLSGFAGKMIGFLKNDGTEVGSILIGNSSVAYNTSSDYRLKENVTAISDGITRLKTLKPYRFNFKDDTTKPIVDGFFAHEVTAVPEAITGTKDQVDADNNPVYQSIDQSKLVPLLVAAVQELITKVETLEAA